MHDFFRPTGIYECFDSGFVLFVSYIGIYECFGPGFVSFVSYFFFISFPFQKYILIFSLILSLFYLFFCHIWILLILSCTVNLSGGLSYHTVHNYLRFSCYVICERHAHCRESKNWNCSQILTSILFSKCPFFSIFTSFADFFISWNLFLS